MQYQDLISFIDKCEEEAVNPHWIISNIVSLKSYIEFYKELKEENPDDEHLPTIKEGLILNSLRIMKINNLEDVIEDFVEQSAIILDELE